MRLVPATAAISVIGQSRVVIMCTDWSGAKSRRICKTAVTPQGAGCTIAPMRTPGDILFEPLRFRNLTVKNRIFRSNISGRFDNYDGSGNQARSEEHTSELQSRFG